MRKNLENLFRDDDGGNEIADAFFEGLKELDTKDLGMPVLAQLIIAAGVMATVFSRPGDDETVHAN